ncbi:EcsC protein family protein [Desulfosporosinus acididurans]|uniref:EcsC protein family protein n=1 Tax=Desulfosporosinus acididurans TaxID=476652 RepID=A0A0J1IGN4_9FIRM|nr:EcsC family protein [Desulfosporosinus acididurans]KLU63876.1 EcsC protein family protein [Desulfosporosinus acididurans]
MDEIKRPYAPVPIIDEKEAALLDALTERYNKLIKPSKIAQISTKAGELIPKNIKSLGAEIAANISAQELYQQAMELITTGFKVVEEQAAKFSISEKTILQKVNTVVSDYEIIELSEVCFARSYSLAKLVNAYKSQDTVAALVEGGATGAFGFWGLPFNMVLSTFLYFRAVQSIAMFYGYDVKNDGSELVIASEVFTNALCPAQNDVNNEVSSILVKIMLMSKAEVVKQTAKKTWSDMAARGGVTLLLAQMRALANKSAQKALEKAGAKGLENSLFREAFEQIGRKLTLKTAGKVVPYFSALFGALIDAAQMQRVLNYADVFYHKRYLLEKENRIKAIVASDAIIIDAEIVGEEEQ